MHRAKSFHLQTRNFYKMFSGALAGCCAASFVAHVLPSNVAYKNVIEDASMSSTDRRLELRHFAYENR